MKMLHLFTLTFIIGKMMGYLDWSWWLVFMPSIFAIVTSIILFVFLALTVFKKERYLR